jgi:hypothetical protein
VTEGIVKLSIYLNLVPELTPLPVLILPLEVLNCFVVLAFFKQEANIPTLLSLLKKFNTKFIAISAVYLP